MVNLPKKVHVIGICGVAMSAIAIALKKCGVEITGSDKGFFPPVSTELENHGIPFYAGWHPDKMIENGTPDIVMIGAASGSQNPETVYAREHGIRELSYPEMLGEYFVKEHSIVCSGTWGKTSSSALLSFILESAGMDPTYMFGGVSLSHDSSAKLTDSSWSVFEGDEYKSSPTDGRAKFFHYAPTYLLLSAVSWDHADMYPTEEKYLEAFRELLSGMREDGYVVARKDQPGIQKVVTSFKGTILTYGLDRSTNRPDFAYLNVEQSTDGIDFDISHKGQTFHIHSPLLGAYQAENITGCFALAFSIGIKTDRIIDAVSKFKGLNRRMEKRLDGTTTTKNITVIDDIAHSAEKVISVLATLKEIFGKTPIDDTGHRKIIAVFEPNSGGRERQSASKYDDAFKNADIVVIPRLTKLKSNTEATTPMEGDELSKTISRTHSNVSYIDDDAKVVDYLAASTKKGDVIAFLGSHGFRGMIEETVKRLS